MLPFLWQPVWSTGSVLLQGLNHSRGESQIPGCCTKNEIKRKIKKEEERSKGRKLEIRVLKPENVSCFL